MALAQQVKILIDGSEIMDYLDLNLQQSIFGHHSLEITCRREDLGEERDGKIIDKSSQYLGGKISLTIKIDDKQKVEFEGIVTEIRASIMSNAQSNVVILEASSLDIILDDGEHCQSFEEKTMKAIAEEILKDYSLSASRVQPEKSSGSMPYTVQYKESAYAFLSRMAAKKGEWFYYNGSEVVFGARNADEIELEYGTDLFNFDYSLKIEDMKFKYMNYTYLNDSTQEYESDSGSQSLSNLSDKAGEAVDASDRIYKKETLSLYNHPLTEGSEQSHLDSRVELIKSALAAGLITCSGSSDNAALKIGGEIKVVDNYDENGDKKSVPVDHGTYILTSLSHTCDRNGNYQNNFSGIPKEIDAPPYSSPHAIPFCETQSAIVRDNNDPEELGRIKVQFLWQKAENGESPWLRMVTPHTGQDQGMFFIPEIGDEVLVAFEGGNAEKPYVIGTHYHGKAKPDSAWITPDNDIKAIRTRSGHTIEFNDTDGGEEVKIYDYNKDNYVITLSSNEQKITIHSAGDMDLIADQNMKIEVGQELTIEAGSNISVEGMDVAMKAGGDMKTEGTNIKQAATAGLELSANSQMKLSCSGILEQTGSLVKIN